MRKGVFERIRDDEIWRYTVDKKTGNLAAFEIEAGPDIIFRQEYFNYTDINGVKFPRFIKIILPQKKEMVAIYHKNIKINERLEKQRYSIDIGPKIKQIIMETPTNLWISLLLYRPIMRQSLCRN